MSQLRNFKWAVVIVALFACTAAVNANVPAVVKLIPDNAVVVATAPSLSSLSTKVAILNQKLALNQPQLNSALGFVKAMSGLNRGINDQGGVALVLTSQIESKRVEGETFENLRYTFLRRPSFAASC